jgi:sulfur-oxidizing protein SoxY
MRIAISTIVLGRRSVLRTLWWSGMGVAGGTVAPRLSLGESVGAHEDDSELIKKLTGRTPVASPRVHLDMPPVFSNGYTVPLTLEVDSPMIQTDYVRLVHVLAPRNPITLVGSFQFTPQSGRARFSTRIRLAEPQNVLAAAEMSDGTVLMTKTWVKVDSNGCA